MQISKQNAPFVVIQIVSLNHRESCIDYGANPWNAGDVKAGLFAILHSFQTGAAPAPRMGMHQTSGLEHGSRAEKTMTGRKSRPNRWPGTGPQ